MSDLATSQGKEGASTSRTLFSWGRRQRVAQPMPGLYEGGPIGRLSMVRCNQGALRRLQDAVIAERLGKTGRVINGGGVLVLADGLALGGWMLPDRHIVLQRIDNWKGYLEIAIAINVEAPGAARLLTAAMLSREAQAVAHEMTHRPYHGVQTAVLSLNPSAAGYRGLMQLDRREPRKDGEGYLLRYRSAWATVTLAQILKLWQADNLTWRTISDAGHEIKERPG